MKNESVETTLATVEDVRKGTYEFVAKDYFEMKKDGLKASTMKKGVWFILASVVFSTITPQIVSQRNRQELAEEIRAQEQPSVDVKMNIPTIYNEDHRSKRNFNEQKSFQKIEPVKKIKSIDLRATNDPPPGAEAKAILISGGANGTVKAKITEDLILNNEYYAPKNSILIGTGSSTDKRLYISFQRLVSPEGKIQKIYAQGYDFKDRIRGLKGKKVSDQLFKIATSSALIFLSGLSESMQDSHENGSLMGQRKSIRDAALGGVAQASSEQGKRILDEMNNDSQIEVQKEAELIVIFENKEDMNGK